MRCYSEERKAIHTEMQDLERVHDDKYHGGKHTHDGAGEHEHEVRRCRSTPSPPRIDPESTPG